MKTFLILIAIMFVSQMAFAVDAETDFQTRCQAPGVSRCSGFDDPAKDMVLNSQIWAGTSTTPSQDTVIKSSGAGAMRFTLPPPPHGGANMAGKWEPQGTGLGASFGPGTTFYTQFRMRVSEGMLNNTWDSSWKFYEMLYNNSTCGNLGIIWVNKSLTGLPSAYTACGGRVVGVAGIDGSLAPPGPPYSVQEFTDGRTCDYPEWYTGNHPDCLYMKHDIWMTFTYQVDVGTFGTPSTRIQAWYMEEGQLAPTQFVDTGSVYVMEGSGNAFNTANFSTYMTGLSPNSGRAGITSFLWIDEFIVSTQPIAQPGGTKTPSPPVSPTGLLVF
jgi:hypothetical protein